MQASQKIQSLIADAETQEAINLLMDVLKTSDKDLYEQVILISAMYKKQKIDERIGVGFDKVVIARVNQSLLSIANELPENTLIPEPQILPVSVSASSENPVISIHSYETDLKAAQEADSQGDYETAVNILSKYESTLDIEGIKILGPSYLLDEINGKNYKKGLALIAKGAKQKDPMCLKIQAIYAYNDAETPEDFEQARAYFETALDILDEDDYEIKDLYFSLGCIYFYGQGLKKSEKTGLRYLKQSAEKGRVEAMVNLMNIYDGGTDTIEANTVEFLKWGEKAAKEGNIEALYGVGIVYYGDEDYESAAEYLEPAANAGNADAQITLGLMLMNGQGVEQDTKSAIKLYKKSAEQGNKLAQVNLGSLYLAGELVPQDYNKAYQLYTEASEQELGVANFMLGHMFANGLGFQKDKTKAKQYYLLALQQGYEGAKAELDSLNSFWGGLFS
jgi:TPR repeat protein